MSGSPRAIASPRPLATVNPRAVLQQLDEIAAAAKSAGSGDATSAILTTVQLRDVRAALKGLLLHDKEALQEQAREVMHEQMQQLTAGSSREATPTPTLDEDDVDIDAVKAEGVDTTHMMFFTDMIEHMAEEVKTHTRARRASVKAAGHWKKKTDGSAMFKMLEERIPATPIGKLRPLMAPLDGWDEFDIFAIDEAVGTGTGNVMLAIGHALLHESGLASALKLEPDKISGFLKCLSSGYSYDNPYHNALHAADVAQGVFHFLYGGGGDGMLAPHLDSWRQLGALVATLVHDVGHFSLTNAFLIATGHDLALTYCEQSPLERMHCATAFRILATPGADLLAPLPADKRSIIKKQILSMVLATDMATHAFHVAELENLTAPDALASFDLNDTTTLDLVLQMTLHACDISNPTKPWARAFRWTECVLAEFFAQGDKERDLGMPISPGFDRTKALTWSDKAKGQMFFIGILVKPLYVAMAKVPGLRIDPLVANIDANLAQWKTIAGGAPPPPPPAAADVATVRGGRSA